MSQAPDTDLDNTLLLETSKGPVAIVMRPERWNTSDFSDLAEQLA